MRVALYEVRASRRRPRPRWRWTRRSGSRKQYCGADAPGSSTASSGAACARGPETGPASVSERDWRDSPSGCASSASGCATRSLDEEAEALAREAADLAAEAGTEVAARASRERRRADE